MQLVLKPSNLQRLVYPLSSEQIPDITGNSCCLIVT